MPITLRWLELGQNTPIFNDFSGLASVAYVDWSLPFLSRLSTVSRGGTWNSGNGALGMMRNLRL